MKRRAVAVVLIFALMLIVSFTLDTRPSSAATGTVTSITCNSVTVTGVFTGPPTPPFVGNVTVAVYLAGPGGSFGPFLGQRIITPAIQGAPYTANVTLNGGTPGAAIIIEVFESFSTPNSILINGQSLPVDCAADSGAVFFEPGDGRVDPQPGDRLAIWCNTTANPPALDIWSVGNDSRGSRLTTIIFADLLKTGNSMYAELKAKLAAMLRQPSPNQAELDKLYDEFRQAAGQVTLVRNLGSNGVLSITVDAQNRFVVAWTGGPYGANGQGSFLKIFKCEFKR
jgi:hypothetical protein